MLPGMVPMVAGGASIASVFPTIAGSVANNSGSTTQTTHTVTLPTGVVAGELLIVLAAIQTSSITVTNPSGWNRFFDFEQIGATSGVMLAGWYRMASGGEASMSFTTSAIRSSARAAYRITGWSGIPEAVMSKGQSASAKPPALSPSWGLNRTLFIAATGIRIGGTVNVSSGPSGYSGLLNAVSTTGSASDVRIGSAYRNSLSLTEDPGAFTLSVSTQDWVAATVAVKPA